MQKIGQLQLPSPSLKSSAFAQHRWESKPEVCSGLILQVPGKKAKINRKKNKSIVLFNLVCRRGGSRVWRRALPGLPSDHRNEKWKSLMRKV